jgi:hypothetical protein
LEAVGVAGVALTVADVDPAADVQPFTVRVTLYVPVAVVVALLIDGFCKVEAKLLGPVQLYVALVTVGVDRVSVWPAQIGPLFEVVGVAGIALTVTVLLQMLLQPLLSMIVSVSVKEPGEPASMLIV